MMKKCTAFFCFSKTITFLISTAVSLSLTVPFPVKLCKRIFYLLQSTFAHYLMGVHGYTGLYLVVLLQLFKWFTGRWSKTQAPRNPPLSLLYVCFTLGVTVVSRSIEGTTFSGREKKVLGVLRCDILQNTPLYKCTKKNRNQNKKHVLTQVI